MSTVASAHIATLHFNCGAPLLDGAEDPEHVHSRVSQEVGRHV